jgi:hypothetical protein
MNKKNKKKAFLDITKIGLRVNNNEIEEEEVYN